MKHLLLILTFILISCGQEVGDPSVTYLQAQTTENLDVLFKSMSDFTMEVHYELGAEPYAGSTSNGNKVWGLTESNVKAIFEGRGQSVNYHIPKELNEMHQFADQAKSTWTTSELLNLEKSLRQQKHGGSNGNFFIVFVNGHFKYSDGEVNKDIIGVSLTGTTVIAIFKDVISQYSAEPGVAKFMEQATIIHEFGHAIGLVNNGVALTSSHQDSEKGAHCSNSDCVLYWANEGRSDMVSFIRKFILSGKTVMFDQACLDDVKAY